MLMDSVGLVSNFLLSPEVALHPFMMETRVRISV